MRLTFSGFSGKKNALKKLASSEPAEEIRQFLAFFED